MTLMRVFHYYILCDETHDSQYIVAELTSFANQYVPVNLSIRARVYLQARKSSFAPGHVGKPGTYWPPTNL